MSRESAFVERLRAIAGDPAARGLADDAAVMETGAGGRLVLTHDTLVTGVHTLPGCPAGDVAWKLVAVNLSDLAAMGATPVGVLLGYAMQGDADWDAAFADGLAEVLAAYGVPLLGGDTVRQPDGDARVLGLTAIGRADAPPPARGGARAGDALYVTGPIGDGWAGLQVLLGGGGDGGEGTEALVRAYRRPLPRLAEGAALAHHVTAMMDVSDGLLIDAGRMAAASGVEIAIDLAAVPLSDAFRAWRGEDRAARLDAATGGDDYQLLAAAPAGWEPPEWLHRIGTVRAGAGLALLDGGEAVPLPPLLGYEHDV